MQPAPKSQADLMKAAMGAVKTMEETMRVLTQTELSRMTRIELMSLLRRISAALPDLAEGSADLREAHSSSTRSCRKARRRMWSWLEGTAHLLPAR